MSHCKQLNTTSNWISPTPTHPLTLLHCQHAAKTQENLYTCTYTCHHPQGCLRFHSDWHLIELQTGCVLVYAHQLLLTQKNPKTSHAAQLYRSRSTAHHTRTTVCRAKCHIACFWLSLPFAVLLFFCFIYFKHVKNPCSHLFGHSCGFTFMNCISYKIQTAHYIYFTMISFQMKQGFPSCYKITATILSLFFQ